MVRIILLFVLISLALASEGLHPGCLRKCLKRHDTYRCRDLCNLIQPMSDSQETPSEFLWRLYRNNLFSFLKRQDRNGFVGMQMMASEYVADWAQNPESLNYFANLMSKYGSIYESSGVSFPLKYESFLLNLKVLSSSATPQDNAKFEDIKQKLYAAENKIQNAIFSCVMDYDMLGSLLSMTYSQFEAMNCRDVSKYEYEKKIISGQFNALSSKIDGPMYGVYQTLSHLGQDTVNAWTDNGHLRNFLGKAKIGQAPKLEISTKNDFKIDEKRSWFKTKSSGFIFTKSKTESKTELRLNYQQFEMRIKAQGFAAIPIQPQGQWFNFAHLQQFRSTSFWKNPNMNFFGERGSMPMMPKVVFVLYKPSVVLNVSEQDGLFFQSHTSSSFSFGPFNLSSKVATMKVEKKNQNNYQVTFDMQTDEAQVVAIDYHLF